MGRGLSALEIEIITSWISNDGYSYTDIKKALLEAVKCGKVVLKYVDAILLNNFKQVDTSSIFDDENAKVDKKALDKFAKMVRRNDR